MRGVSQLDMLCEQFNSREEQELILWKLDRTTAREDYSNFAVQ